MHAFYECIYSLKVYLLFDVSVDVSVVYHFATNRAFVEVLNRRGKRVAERTFILSAKSLAACVNAFKNGGAFGTASGNVQQAKLETPVCSLKVYRFLVIGLI